MFFTIFVYSRSAIRTNDNVFYSVVGRGVPKAEIFSATYWIGVFHEKCLVKGPKARKIKKISSTWTIFFLQRVTRHAVF